jgi:hypothetical protein
MWPPSPPLSCRQLLLPSPRPCSGAELTAPRTLTSDIAASLFLYWYLPYLNH